MSEGSFSIYKKVCCFVWFWQSSILFLRYLGCHGAYKEIHYDEVTDTSGHDENMKDFMGSKILMFGVEDWKLQSIDDTSDGVDDTSGQEPGKSCMGKCAVDGNQCQDTQPSHANVENGRYPFRTGNPHCLEDNSDDGN